MVLGIKGIKELGGIVPITYYLTGNIIAC